jgi:hypothetical protein
VGLRELAAHMDAPENSTTSSEFAIELAQIIQLARGARRDRRARTLLLFGIIAENCGYVFASRNSGGTALSWFSVIVTSIAAYVLARHLRASAAMTEDVARRKILALRGNASRYLRIG